MKKKNQKSHKRDNEEIVKIKTSLSLNKLGDKLVLHLLKTLLYIKS